MKNKSQLILLSVSAVLIVGNVLLLWQNIALKAIIRGSHESLTREGDFLNEFKATNLDGSEAEINFHAGADKRVLLFFRTTCKFCQEQMKLWKTLASGVDRRKFKVTAVTTEKESVGIREFMRRYGVEDWEVLEISSEDAKDAKFGLTPLTAVVDQDGKVVKSWAGLWSEDQLRGIGEYFDVNFSNS